MRKTKAKVQHKQEYFLDEEDPADIDANDGDGFMEDDSASTLQMRRHVLEQTVFADDDEDDDNDDIETKDKGKQVAEYYDEEKQAPAAATAEYDNHTNNNHDDLESTQRDLKTALLSAQQDMAEKGATKTGASDDGTSSSSSSTPGPLQQPRRQSALSGEVTPGAFQGAPGQDFQRINSNWKQGYRSGSSRLLRTTSANTAASTRYEDREAPLSLLEEAPSHHSSRDDEDASDNNKEGLAQANRVDEEKDLEMRKYITIAEPFDEKPKAFTKRRRQQTTVEILLMLGMLLLFGLVIGLVVRSVRPEQQPTSSTKQPSSPTTAPTTSSSPTVAPTDFIFSNLSESTQQAILFRIDENGEEASTPQAKAYEWVLQDPSWFNYTDSRLRQRFALATLYYATTVDDAVVSGRNGNATATSTSNTPGSWGRSTNWLSYNVSECSWYPSLGTPFDCNDEEEILRLQLFDNLLQGSLPPEIGLLTSLTELDVSDNFLSHSLPTELGLLTQLTSLQLENNTLTGSVPTEIGYMTSLERMYVFDNPSLQGDLPTQLGLLTQLREWHMHRTDIGGPLPTELGWLTGLRNFWAWNTQLSGTLPTQLGNMTSLTSLPLHKSNFTKGTFYGTIPTEMGLLTNLEHLQVDVHNLTGSIPSELGQLKQIKFLSFGSNLLNSTLPTELALLSDTAQALRFYQNELTGKIPSEFGSLGKMQRLEIDSNQLTGSLPTELGLCSSLDKFFLAKNQFSGTLPSEFSQLPMVTQITLNQNRALSGTIPPEWHILAARRLEELFLTGVNITGSIPSELCSLNRLQVDCDANANICGCDCKPCA